MIVHNGVVKVVNVETALDDLQVRLRVSCLCGALRQCFNTAGVPLR